MVGAHGERRDAARGDVHHARLQHHAAAVVGGSPDGHYNHPPVLRFTRERSGIQNPVASRRNGHPADGDRRRADAIETLGGRRCAVCQRIERADRQPSAADRRVDGREVPRTRDRDRGPSIENVVTIRGGKPMEPFAGKVRTIVTFSEPGDYLLHVTANDFSEKGGGSTGCCWTTALVKVLVSGNPRVTITGR